MNGRLLCLVILGIGCGCSQQSGNNQIEAAQDASRLPRIAIAGLAIESSTFSPARTEEEAFHAKTGDDVLALYPFLSSDSAERKRADWVPILIGRALPGGTVTRQAYESLVSKMLDSLKRHGPYDGLFLISMVQ